MDELPGTTLSDLVSPLSVDAFVEEHWNRDRWFLSQVNDALLERILAMPRLENVEALLKGERRDVMLFGPRGTRVTVPAQAATAFLDDGYNLYVTGVEQMVPEAKTLMLEVLRPLGGVPSQFFLEAFAGRKGGVSTRHYDHDINFQILLHGEKEWTFEQNTNIDNPLVAYHPKRDRSGRLSGLPEEAYAREPRVSATFVDPEVVRASAGTVAFLPRAYWHEVRSLSDTWSLNLVIKGQTLASALTTALLHRLHRQPGLRKYFYGFPYGEGDSLEPPPVLDVDRLFAAARDALNEITLVEMGLVGAQGRFVWNEASDGREIVSLEGTWHLAVPGLLSEPLELEEGLVTPLRELVRLREPFQWEHALAVTGLGAAELCNLLSELVEMGVLQNARQEG